MRITAERREEADVLLNKYKNKKVGFVAVIKFPL